MGTRTAKRTTPRLKASVLGLLGAGALASLAANDARADQFSATRSKLLVEQEHLVDLQMYPGYAQMTVTRTAFNGGKKHDQGTFMIDVPPGAVAVGLRTLGKHAGRPRWFDGVLMEAEAAAAKYRELTGIGGYYPKDPALLSWRSQSLLALQVFPCPPGERKSVEYTLLIPTTYSAGAHHVSLPGLGTQALMATLKARAGRRGDSLRVDGKAGARAGGRMARGGSVELELTSASAPRLDGELASFAYNSSGALTRLRVETSAKLSSVPKKAQIVVVLDTSRSLTQGYVDAHVNAARSTLSNFPGAEVEVLTFDRKVRRRHGKFVSVKHALADLTGLSLKRHNGSNIDEALEQASQLLASRPGPRTSRRVLVFTDARPRSWLTPTRLGSSFDRQSGIVHVALLDDGGSPRLFRDDQHVWAKWVNRTGGVVWAGDAGYDDQAARAVMEELARPLRLHRLKVDVPPGHKISEQQEAELPEGEGFSVHQLDGKPFAWVKVEGQSWAETVRLTLVPNAQANQRAAALVFGSDRLHDLSEREMMPLAVHGKAVSPVTSYLAIEPGVRPSTEGLDWAAGAGGMGMGRAGRVRMGATGVGKGGPRVDAFKFLQDKISEGWKKCGGQKSTGKVTLETTDHEIVALPSLETPSAGPVLRRCVREHIWALELPESIDWYQDRWVVRL